MSPKVSVIIAAYNVEPYITQAIHSALQQTETDLEVIVVDDASVDKTLEILQSFQDPRIRILANQHNLGASASRNRGIKAAQGDWIALLDADDWFAPERLEKLLDVIQSQPDTDLIADDLYYINEEATSPWSTLLSESDESIDDIHKIDSVYLLEKDIPVTGGFYVGLTKPIIRRDFLLENKIEFDTKLRVCFDFWFCLSCLVSGANFFFLPQPYYFFRSRGGSLTTADKSDQLDEFCQAGRAFLRQAAVQDDPEIVQLISTRLDFIEHKIKPYYCVVDRLKNREWKAAVISMVQNPYFFIHLKDQLKSILKQRAAEANQTL